MKSVPTVVRVKPLVYLAGPYTKPEPVENTVLACKLATKLVKDNVVTPIIPHLTMLWHLTDPQPYQFWLDYDVECLRRCDALLRIPGESAGADAEEKVAREEGIPIFHTTESLYAWAYSA
jgi:nucleoside 2-deoxyribosyltransferase